LLRDASKEISSTGSAMTGKAQTYWVRLRVQECSERKGKTSFEHVGRVSYFLLFGNTTEDHSGDAASNRAQAAHGILLLLRRLFQKIH
jgi:hypothetical protein